MTASDTTKERYAKACEKLKEISTLQGISGLLDWDEMVMMPSGGADSRAAQKSALTGVLYDKETDAELGTLLNELVAESEGLDPWALANIREAHKNYIRATAIPKDLAQRIARHQSEGYQAWVQARTESNFTKFAPVLEKWVELSKEKAAYIDPTRPAYDVLLDIYEKGMTSARLDAIFTEVRTGLVPLLAEIRAKADAIDASWFQGKYDTAKQADLCKSVSLDMGFSLDNGRLDVTVHPFCAEAHPTDVRMATRFKEEDVMEGLTGAIHETGHALYEQGRNLEFDGLPVNGAMSMGIHESQSLLWERMVALSPPFTKYLLPKLAVAFPDKFDDKVTPEELHRAMNKVHKESLIRVEADEVSYPMHVILRYELETGLINGTIKVDDLPALWNQKMEAYLGVTPPDDAKGVLQDVHWGSGLFGYFPTYSLGAMYATQIFNTARQQIDGLDEQIAAGNFKNLKAWLNEKIHKVGSLHTSGDELMQAATGSALDPQVFLSYLRGKYSGLYSL